MRNKFTASLLVLLSVLLILQPLLTTLPSQAFAQTANIDEEQSAEASSDDWLSPVDEQLPPGEYQIQSVYDFQTINDLEGALEISPQDLEKIKDLEVDARVTNYLLSLVMPTELGGQGLNHVKAGRILKGYDTDGIGRLDRESAEAVEEDGRAVSNHARGQAVDITEVGSITCKLVQRRHLGGSTTKWQRPRTIKVAWQSVDGISRHPTPKSPSLIETAGVLSADGILRMLNDSGEMDAYVDYVKGMDLESILTYVGANILLKNGGINKITGDPLADSLIEVVGWSMLEKSAPGLPDGLIAQNDEESVRVATARARLEEVLNLPPGSLRGRGWDEVLRNAGERSLENALGLPVLFFEDHSLEEAHQKETVRAALRHLARGDDAFDFIDGTIEKIEKKDQEGLKMAGVSVISSAFKLTNQQRTELIAAVRQQRRPDIDPTSLSTNKEFTPESMRLLFSENPTEQNEALKQFEQLGKTILEEAFKKAGASRYEGVTQVILNTILTKPEYRMDELKRTVGAVKMGYDFSLSERDIKALARGDTTKAEPIIAAAINKEYELSGNQKVTSADVRGAIKTKDFSLLQKIGGAQADVAMGWHSGTGLSLINGEKKLNEAAEEIFGNAFGQILGLKQGTEFSLKGNLQKNYGHSLIEQRLGLKLDKPNANDYDSQTILNAFGLRSDKTLHELVGSSDYWYLPETVDALALSDARLGVSSGTSEKFLKGQLNADQFTRQTASDNIANVAYDQIWNYFDLEDRFRIKKEEADVLFAALRHWDEAPFEEKDRAMQMVYKLMGRQMDARTGFAVDFFVTYLTSPDKGVATELLLNEGIRQLAIGIGVNLEGFSDDDLKAMTERIIRIFDNRARPSNPNAPYNPLNPGASEEVRSGDEKTWIKQLVKATKIPEQYQSDVAAFVEGDFRHGLAAWSASIWSEFANKYLPDDAQLTYAEARNTIVFENQAAIEQRAIEIVASTSENPALYSTMSPEEKAALHAQARRQLIQEHRDNVQFKISDAFIEQATGQDLPAGFSRTMMTGDDKQRAEMLMQFGLTRIESALRAVEPSYQEGTLEKIFKGELSAREGDQIVLTIINRSGVSIGPFDTQFIGQFYRFIKSQGARDFYTNPEYRGMWNYFDNWLEDTLGIGQLPVGISQSLYFASQNGWKLDASLTNGAGQIVVPSLSQLGENFLIGKISEFGDKQFGLPAGSTFRIYQATKSFLDAQRLYAGAKTAANAAALGKAQAELTVIAITIALNACEACQQFFASVDKALAAPPGFTNAAVAGAIAMAFGLGPAGLIAAAVIYLVGVYRVDYLCPIPPPDIYALTSFDPAADQLDYTWGDYYSDETRVVKDNPAPGENPFDWDEGLPFTDGNDPNLWRAWARYFTGKTLEATMVYGETIDRPYKPLQVITYRQANVEYFYPRSTDAFGQIEEIFPWVGMGYSQKTTKTTDAIHVGFGGWF